MNPFLIGLLVGIVVGFVATHWVEIKINRRV
jgi:uncharacterized membrane-anchored protein YhcB (DUF1043 family)